MGREEKGEAEERGRGLSIEKSLFFFLFFFFYSPPKSDYLLARFVDIISDL